MKTYQIKSVSDLRNGDIIKISRKMVDHVGFDAKGQTVVTFKSGASGTFFGTERVGVYR